MNGTETERQIAEQQLAKKDTYTLTTQRDRRIYAFYVALVGTGISTMMILANFYFDNDSLSLWDIAEVVVYAALFSGLSFAASFFSRAKPRYSNRQSVIAVISCVIVTLFIVFPYINYNYFHYTNPQDSVPIGVVFGGILIASAPAWFVAIYVLRDNA